MLIHLRELISESNWAFSFVNVQWFVAYGSFKDASYNGGGNITARGTLGGTAYFKTRLFQGQLPLQDLPLHVTYSVRLHGSSQVGLAFTFSSDTSERTSILLASSGDTLITMNQFASNFDKVIMPLHVTKLETEAQASPGWVIQEGSIAMNGHTLTDIHMVCYKSKPEVSEGNELTLTSPGYSASLGHITIRTSEQNFPPSTSWVVKGEYISWTKTDSVDSNSLSIKIFWKLGNDNCSLQFPKFNIYVSKIVKQAVDGKTEGTNEYIGVARVQAFYVSDFVVPAGISNVKFVIQVCGIDGYCQELNSCPTFLLNVEGAFVT